MMLFRALLKSVARGLGMLINQVNIHLLRLKGVSVHSTAKVHPFAIIEPSGGSITIGANTFIDRGVVLRSLGGYIVIGERCFVHAYSVLYGGGGLTVGNDVLIATHSVIVPSDHLFQDLSRSIAEQGLSLVGIVIEDDVWLGAGARVLDGVKIAKGTVVGSGAVVTRSTQANTVIVGVPARIIKKRN